MQREGGSCAVVHEQGCRNTRKSLRKDAKVVIIDENQDHVSGREWKVGVPGVKGC